MTTAQTEVYYLAYLAYLEWWIYKNKTNNSCTLFSCTLFSCLFAQPSGHQGLQGGKLKQAINGGYDYHILNKLQSAK